MKIHDDIGRWTRSLIDVVFPRVCTVCHTTLIDGEDIMCLGCLADFPRIDFKGNYTDNDMTVRLTSLHAPVTRAAALFHYVAQSRYVRLIHDSKYNRRPLVGKMLAERHSAELKAAGFFSGIDLLLPVPIHFTKRLVRGYNQSYEIATGIQRATGIPIGDNLFARRPHSTQTLKSAQQRRENPVGIFGVHDINELEGRHVLVIDDVVTTGSTMLSVLEEIHKASPSTQMSVYSLALTHMS
ncbi:MAG: hypothetical protein K2K92_00300, partial [Duncaniella sp.]|nr:hypothetical protein [Duncaniella sp.]